MQNPDGIVTLTVTRRQAGFLGLAAAGIGAAVEAKRAANGDQDLLDASEEMAMTGIMLALHGTEAAVSAGDILAAVEAVAKAIFDSETDLTA